MDGKEVAAREGERKNIEDNVLPKFKSCRRPCHMFFVTQQCFCLGTAVGSVVRAITERSSIRFIVNGRLVECWCSRISRASSPGSAHSLGHIRTVVCQRRIRR